MRDPKNDQLPLSAGIEPQPGDVVFAVNRKGRITYWNEEAVHAFGHSPEEVLGSQLDSICPLTVVGPGRARLDFKDILDGREFAGGVEGPRSDGTVLALYLYAAPGRGRGGRTEGVVFIARDVTPFWRAEQAVRSSEEKYRLLFDSSSDFVIIAQPDARIVEANGAASRLCGYDTGRLTGMSFFELVPSGRRHEAEALFAELARKRSLRRVLRLQGRSGAGAMVELNASVLEIGGERRVLVIGRDVTERLAAEQALRDSEERYREIFAAVGDGVFLETLEGEILDVNESACQLLGYSRAELLRKRVEDLVPEESRVWLPQITEALVKHGTFRGEAVNLRKDGTELPVELSCSRVGLGGQRLVIALVRDITERKAAEKALRESEENFRALADNASDGILIAVGPGNHVYANRRAAEITGYSAEELRRSSLETLAHPEERAMLRDRYDRRMRGEAMAAQYETRIVNRRGEAVPIEITAAKTSWHGDDADLVVIRDITERKAAEEALRRSEEKYRNVVERANDGICVVKDACIKYVNPSLVRMMGYSAEEVIDRDFLEYIHPEGRRQVLERYQKRMAGEDVEPVYETVLKGKAGNLVEAELNAGLVFYEGGPADLVIIRDITERKRAETRMRFLLQSIPNAVLYQTGAGVEYVSPNVREMLGYPASDLTGDRNFFPSLMHPDDIGQIEDNYRRWLNEGADGVLEQEFRARRSDGRYVWLLDRSRLAFRDEEGRASTLGVLVDITERRSAERALSESELRYRTSLDAMWDAVHVIDAQYRFVLFNARFREWTESLGLATDVIGRGLFQVFPFLSDKIKEEYRRVFETADSVVTEETTRVGGNEIITDTRKIPIIEDGRVVRVLTTVRDVTRARTAERQVRESRRALATLMSNLRGMAYRRRDDDNLTMEFVSEGCLELTGYYPEDIVANSRVSYAEIVHPHDLPLVAREVRAALGDREPFELTYRLRTADGRAKWVMEQGQGVFSEDGSLLALEGFITDVSKRRVAEESLRASEERYSTLFRGVPIGVYRTTPDGRILMANPSLIRMLGYDDAMDLMSRNLNEEGFQPAYPRGRFVEIMEREGEVSGLESAWTRQDGSVIHIRENAKLVRDAEGKALYYEGTVEDITERKRAEQELKDSEGRYRSLFDLSPDGIAVHQGGKVVTVNPAGARLLGYSTPEEMVGVPVLDFVHPDDRGGVAERIRGVLTRGTTGEPVEERFRRKDGSYIQVEAVNAPFRWHGKPAVLVVVRDISERQRLAEEIQTVLGHSPHPLCVEVDGRVLFVNRAFVDLYGYSRPVELVGRRIVELIAERDRAAYETATDVTGGVRFHGIRRDGSEFMLRGTRTEYSLGGRSYVLSTHLPVRDDG